MQIFAGSGSKQLGESVARLMGQELGRVEVGKFANGEVRVKIVEKVVEPMVAIIQSLNEPADERMMELALMVDAINRMGASQVVAVVPWLSYSKQDKVFLPGEALGAKVAAKFLQTTGIKRLFSFDLHNRAILGFFDIPVVELSAKPLLKNYFRDRMGANAVVVAPDAGAVKGATTFATELGLPVVYMDKRRDLATGAVEVVGMSRSVEGCEVLVVDDNLFTGATIIELAKYLRERGATKIRVGLTHNMYVPGVLAKIEQSEVDELVITDSVEGPAAPKVVVLSLAPVIAEALLTANG